MCRFGNILERQRAEDYQNILFGRLPVKTVEKLEYLGSVVLSNGGGVLMWLLAIELGIRTGWVK